MQVTAIKAHAYCVIQRGSLNQLAQWKINRSCLFTCTATVLYQAYVWQLQCLPGAAITIKTNQARAMQTSVVSTFTIPACRLPACCLQPALTIFLRIRSGTPTGICRHLPWFHYSCLCKRKAAVWQCDVCKWLGSICTRFRTITNI